MMKKSVLSLLWIVLFVFATSANAADVTILFSGQPTSAKEGGTKSSQINLSAPSRNINLAKIPATVTVHTEYTLVVGGGSNAAVPDEVLPARHAPTVTIATPANGGTYKVNQPVDVSVEIVSDFPLTSYTASLNGTPVNLRFYLNDNAFEAPLVLSKPGESILYVQACNSVGCGDATSQVIVKYDFGG
jgi:hypothetical protein